MAKRSKAKIDLSWGDDLGFTMEAKLNEEPNTVVIHVDFDECTTHAKPQIAEICNNCFSRAIQRALDELKQEA